MNQIKKKYNALFGLKIKESWRRKWGYIFESNYMKKKNVYLWDIILFLRKEYIGKSLDKYIFSLFSECMFS